MSAAAMDGGADTARVGASEADQAARRARQIDARGNLAAMVCKRWGIDPSAPENHWCRLGAAARDFARLADMLGLRELP